MIQQIQTRFGKKPETAVERGHLLQNRNVEVFRTVLRWTKESLLKDRWEPVLFLHTRIQRPIYKLALKHTLKIVRIVYLHVPGGQQFESNVNWSIFIAGASGWGFKSLDGGTVMRAVPFIPRIGRSKRKAFLLCWLGTWLCFSTTFIKLIWASWTSLSDFPSIWMQPETAALRQAAWDSSLEPQRGTTKGLWPPKWFIEALRVSSLVTADLMEILLISWKEEHRQAP